ncbi:hypothetical protein JYU29_05050 [Tianweitania sp. BSSL-BM11]|uniref:Pentapeptide repeat-containing protein n=1 Tax=Tianweitania aestuarii TaxID=2814886 RepID=A0ABS5RSM3_9HYPH|nr:hypothetical protein [Tianweitania aestuarii]MBS9720055.1 hypothetical protein [Tianweitania aestuarii]
MAVQSEKYEPKPHNREVVALCLAISFAVILGLAALWAGVRASALADFQQRALYVQSVAPFGALAIAAVTFCTVIWRGFISVRQADTGLDQLDQLRHQIAVTQENNLASLLQNGAELLSDDNEPKIRAGYLTLQTLAESGSDKYHLPVRNLLVSYVQRNASVRDPELIRDIVKTQNEIFANAPDRVLAFAHINYGLKRFSGFLDGIVNLSIKEAVISLEEIRQKSGLNRTFVECRFEFCTIDARLMSFVNCEFNHCNFLSLTNYAVLSSKFSNCEFSGTAILGAPKRGFRDIRADLNFYDPSNPPVGEGWDLDWSQYIQATPHPVVIKPAPIT